MFTISKQLQVGQRVNLIGLEAGCQITVLDPDQSGPRIVELTSEFVVLDDEAAGVRTRIPLHLVSAVLLPPLPLAQSA